MATRKWSSLRARPWPLLLSVSSCALFFCSSLQLWRGHSARGDMAKVEQRRKLLAKQTRLQPSVLMRHTFRRRSCLTTQQANCSENSARCNEYVLHNPFHLLIIEDSILGPAVYTIDAQLNEKPGAIETSLLEALSRHSNYELTAYSSKEAEREVGYIRRLTSEELVKLRRRNVRKTTVIEYSPLETHLIDHSVLEYRSFSEPEVYHDLEQLDAKSVMEYIKSEAISFVLFWTNVNTVSQHAFYLWAKASGFLKQRFPDIAIGALPCHKEREICDNMDVTLADMRTVIAYRNGRRYSSSKHLGDVSYYVAWASLILMGPLMQLHTVDELKEAKKGHLKQFDGVQPAVTVGIFKDEDTDEFYNFTQAAKILKGRYHMAYYIKPDGAGNSVITVRPTEKTKRIDHKGLFAVDALAHFIAKSSFPAILDISHGFTANILLKDRRRPLLILLTSQKKNFADYADFCSRMPSYLCTVILREQCEAAEEVMKHMNIRGENSKVILIHKEKIFAIDYDGEGGKKFGPEAVRTLENSDPVGRIADNLVHPLRYLQLAKINEVFGFQEMLLLPEPKLSHANTHHGSMNLDGDAHGGCPFMRNMQKTKDEL